MEAKVVVFIPPPVPPGEAPINITLGGIYSFREQKNISIFKKRIPQAIVLRALTLTLTAILLVLTASIIMMLIERENFIKVIF